MAVEAYKIKFLRYFSTGVLQMDKSIAYEDEKNGVDWDSSCIFCGRSLKQYGIDSAAAKGFICRPCAQQRISGQNEVAKLVTEIKTNFHYLFNINFKKKVKVKLKSQFFLLVHKPLNDDDLADYNKWGELEKKKNCDIIKVCDYLPIQTLIAVISDCLAKSFIDDFVESNKIEKVELLEKKIAGLEKWFMVRYLYLIGEIDYAKNQDFILRLRADTKGAGYVEWNEVLGSSMCNEIFDVDHIEQYLRSNVVQNEGA